MRLRRRVLGLLLPLAVLLVLALGTVYWGRQQRALAVLAETQRDDAVARAATAQTRALNAEAQLTSIALQQLAAATATAAIAQEAQAPQRALDAALSRLSAAYQNPLGPAYDALPQVFGPDALQIVRSEADYLRANGLHLGGSSTFSVDPDPPSQIGPDSTSIHTRERWQYEERDQSDRSVRCFVETSDQSYTLERKGQGWQVQSVALGPTQRSGC